MLQCFSLAKATSELRFRGIVKQYRASDFPLHPRDSGTLEKTRVESVFVPLKSPLIVAWKFAELRMLAKNVPTFAIEASQRTNAARNFSGGAD